MSNGNINPISIRFNILVSQPFHSMTFCSQSTTFSGPFRTWSVQTKKPSLDRCIYGWIIGMNEIVHVFIRKYKLKFWFWNTRGSEYNSAPFSSSERVIPIRPHLSRSRIQRTFQATKNLILPSEDSTGMSSVLTANHENLLLFQKFTVIGGQKTTSRHSMYP